MAKQERPWTVTPHSPLKKLESNLWVVDSQVPGTTANRRMSIVRLADGGLVFYHAIPLEPGALAEVLAWGTPRALVIGHHQHGVDAAAFSEKLNIGIYGPVQVEKQMRARWPRYAGTLEALPKDASCVVEALDGTRWGDPVQVVRSGDTVSLVWCDAFIANDDATTPFFPRLMGLGGGARIAPMFRFFLMKDGAKLKAHFEKLAAMPGLKHLVPCHGAVISDDAAGVLRRCTSVL